MEIVSNEELGRYISEIKKEYFSRSNFPKLVIGTGLSISYEVAGMKDLSEDFNNFFDGKFEFADIWPEVNETISENGLESGLQAPIITNSLKRDEFIRQITLLSSNRVLRDTKNRIESIKDRTRGFMRLISYLSETVGVNNKLIDIMTPNYDLIIELVCEELGVGIIDGFSGDFYRYFTLNELSSPQDFLKLGAKPYVRLFKPHGSINWVSIDNKTLRKVNDFGYLSDHTNELQIIAPGSSKYEMGMTEAIFSNNRETFNNVLRDSKDCPLVVYGYGFNDKHFNNSIFGTNKKILVISYEIKDDILISLQENSKAVAFYKKNDKNFMLYKSHIYKIEREMWDLDVLVSQMVA